MNNRHTSGHGPPSKNASVFERLGPGRPRQNNSRSFGRRTVTIDPNVQNDSDFAYSNSSRGGRSNHRNAQQHAHPNDSSQPQHSRSDRSQTTHSYRDANGYSRSDRPFPNGAESRSFYGNSSRRSPDRTGTQRDRESKMNRRSTNVPVGRSVQVSSRQNDHNNARYHRQEPYGRHRTEASTRRQERPSDIDRVARRSSPTSSNTIEQQVSQQSSSKSSSGKQTEGERRHGRENIEDGSSTRSTQENLPTHNTTTVESTEERQNPALSQHTLEFIFNNNYVQQEDIDYEDEIVTDADLGPTDTTQPEQQTSNNLETNDLSSSTEVKRGEESSKDSIKSPRKESDDRGLSNSQNEADTNQRNVNSEKSTKSNAQESTSEDLEIPYPWKRYISKTQEPGRPYYYNDRTDAVKWNLPEHVIAKTNDRKDSKSPSSTQVTTTESEDWTRRAEDERERHKTAQQGESSQSVQPQSRSLGKRRAHEDDPDIMSPAEKRSKRDDYGESNSRNDQSDLRHRSSVAQPRSKASMPLVPQEDLYRQQELDRRPNRPSYPTRAPRAMEPPLHRRPRESSPLPPLPSVHAAGLSRRRSPLPSRGRRFDDNSRIEDPRHHQDLHPNRPRHPERHASRPSDNPNNLPVATNREFNTYSSQQLTSSSTSQDTRSQDRGNNRPSGRRDDVITNSRTERNGRNKDSESGPYYPGHRK